MMNFFKYFKGIAYFQIMLILFQSCTISTIPQAIESYDRLIKIKTIDGVKYKLKWIEEEGENIVSIKNTKREYINKNEIIQIVKQDPEPHIISLESSLKQNGVVHILVKDKNGKYESHKFIKISGHGDLVAGYKMANRDTSTVIIAIEQIEKIQIQNKGDSTVLTPLAFIILSLC